MAKYKPYERFAGGISDFIREGITDSFAFARSVDTRTDPQNISVLPRTVKESGTVVTDLIKWSETYSSTLKSYMYGDTGNVYSRTSAGSYASLFSIANSHGNGLVYSAEDDFLYGSSDKLIWRYGPLSQTPTLVADFFGSQGGTPLNTYSLDLEASSSQYASRADTATLSITSSIAMSAQIKPESLPTSGNQMVIMSKWDEAGVTRSYKFDISAGSSYAGFGDGSDGALTISSDTTEAPIDSACTGTTGATSLSATNASFATGQVIMIHQSQGTNAGQWERNTISGYTAGTITLTTALLGTYTTGAQVRVLKQYTNVTINSGKTYTAKAWNGTVGGILGFLANGTVTVAGTITATGKGFTGGSGTAAQSPGASADAYQGEGTAGVGTRTYLSNGNGGGGGYTNYSSPGVASSGTDGGSGGAGGGNGSTGVNGDAGQNRPGDGGVIVGSADLTTMLFGGGGGGGKGESNGTGTGGNGSAGGGIIFIAGSTYTVGGAVTANGVAGENATPTGTDGAGGGGGGAGGSILLKSQTATLGTLLTTATGGTGGLPGLGASGSGGAGGAGRIHLDYYTSYTGTTNPTLDATKDNTLASNTGYYLRLLLSSTGSNSEILTLPANIQIGAWQQVAVSWEAASKTATFYLNADSIGSVTGSLGAIHDNASRFAVGASYNGAGAAANFYDGLIDEARVYNGTRSASDFFYGLNQQIATNTVYLTGYYKFNNNYADATANANDLTATNAPVFSIDVPWPSATTRLDIDQSGGGTGDTYAVPTAISEATVDSLVVTPAKDPQKSIILNVGNIGTGTWVVTVHDQYNNVLATSTVLNADMHTGQIEFIFASVWRPLTNFTNTYHYHVTCASGSPTLVSSSNNNLQTAQYSTIFQFLVEDTSWHPMCQFLNYWVVGNERYVGKYESTLYDPNKIVLQAGFRVRCFAYWREYLAIGCMRGSSITDFDNGRVYFWDGYSPTFNFYIDVPEGGVNAMLGTKGILYVWAGYKSQLLAYQGGDSAQKLRDLPKMENDKYLEVFPQAVTMYQSLLRYAPGGAGDSTEANRGSYTYGSTNLRYPEILTLDHIISTGNYGSGVNIGMQTVVDEKLLISWKDMLGYGVDYVDPTNYPYASSMIQFLVNNEDATWKEKEALEIDAVFTPLLTGESVDLSYSLEGSSTFTTNPDSPSVGDTVSRMLLGNGRYHETQVEVDITAITTAPTIKSVLLTSNLNESEGRTG